MPVPEQSKWQRGIGLSNVYYDVEVDELIGNAAAGIPPAGFTDAAPIKYADPPVQEQANGDPIGLSPDGSAFFQPLMVAAVPIVVAGKRYLIPLIEE